MAKLLGRGSIRCKVLVALIALQFLAVLLYYSFVVEHELDQVPASPQRIHFVHAVNHSIILPLPPEAANDMAENPGTMSFSTTATTVTDHLSDLAEDTNIVTSPSASNNICTEIEDVSWKQLNEQQFCSIECSNRYQRQLMQHIYDLQFNQACDTMHSKYLIYDVWAEKGNGLGAMVYGSIKQMFSIALKLNRTFLLHGWFDWAKEVSYCQDTHAMECYFLPLSNCDSRQILDAVNKSDGRAFFKGSQPPQCKFGIKKDDDETAECPQTVIYINFKAKHAFNALKKWVRAQYNLSMFQYEAVVTNFIMRPQPNVKQIIWNKIHQSINKSIATFSGGTGEIIPSQTLSLPIRASDKCYGMGDITHKHYAHKPESTCFAPVEYVQLMNVIKYLSNATINTVILTSEDAAFLSQVILVMQHSNYSNVSDWNIIQNTEDFSVGEGTTTYHRTMNRFGGGNNHSNASHDHMGQVGSSLETDHIISALSSLLLQIHLEPAYIAYLMSSTWTKAMWNWLAKMNCNFDRALHAPHANKNKCIALHTQSYQEPHLENNLVVFSKQMWHTIHAKNLTAQRFFDRFGIHIAGHIDKDGWNSYCEEIWGMDL